MVGIRAVLFDFGGVLAEEGFSNGLETLAREQDLAVDNMTAEGMQAVYDSGFVLGQGSEPEFWALLRERTGLQGDDAYLHQRMFYGFVMRPWMLELVEQLRHRGYITGILSDQTDWLDELDAEHDFFKFFDRVYNSYYLGKGKRDPSHFGDIAADLGLAPAAIVFVDDSEANVDNARAAGMLAILYSGRDTFLKSLDKILQGRGPSGPSLG